MPTRWHLLMTKPRDDARAEEHLRNQDYEIFRPLLRHLRLQGGRQKAVVESLFPRYIFIRLNDEFSNWSRIRSTRGVAGLVRFTEQPAVVPQDLVDTLLAKVGADNVLDNTTENPFLYHPGDTVLIQAGSFRGLQAIVKAQTSEERVVILLDMLGKTQSLEMPIAALGPVAGC